MSIFQITIRNGCDSQRGKLPNLIKLLPLETACKKKNAIYSCFFPSLMNTGRQTTSISLSSIIATFLHRSWCKTRTKGILNNLKKSSVFQLQHFFSPFLGSSPRKPGSAELCGLHWKGADNRFTVTNNWLSDKERCFLIYSTLNTVKITHLFVAAAS